MRIDKRTLRIIIVCLAATLGAVTAQPELVAVVESVISTYDLGETND